ncbi:MAG: uroporphyrinogen decarboxylase family protein [bacterium]
MLQTDSEKEAVWKAYWDRKPTRVPLRWNTNIRIILLNPALNPERYTFEQYFKDPIVTMTIQARHQEYCATVLSQVCDNSGKIPEKWSCGVDTLNTYDGAYFGAPVVYDAGQVPSNVSFMTEADVDGFLGRDFSRPLENPWVQEKLKFREEMVKAARDFEYAGRGVDVRHFEVGFDGPVTIGAVLMGTDLFSLLGAEPEKAIAFMRKIMEAVVVRNQTLTNLHGKWQKGDWGWAADDSIQLLSAEMYEKLILPLHEWWYSAISTATPASKARCIHLCGDVMRHMPILHRRLGVTAFDTGFPIDFGSVRRELGPDVEISGGPHVALLTNGTPAECAKRTKEILLSGVKQGGRFILQEGNNLPPRCPMDNLKAVYETCLEYGKING